MTRFAVIKFRPATAVKRGYVSTPQRRIVGPVKRNASSKAR